MDTVHSARPGVDARWAGVRRVLAVRLDNLGDVVMTTPALRAIQDGLPGARITLLGSPGTAAALENLPMLEAIIPYQAPWTKGPGDAGTARDHALIAQLAAGRFDAAIIFTVCTQSALPAALLCRLASIALRLAHSRENPYDLLTDWVPDTEQVHGGMRHEVRRQLDLVGTVGLRTADERMVWYFNAAHVRGMRRAMTMAGCPDGRPYAVIHVGASASSRRYPAQRFAAAADRFARASGCHIVLTGGADECALVEGTRALMACPSTSLAGRLTLGELGALLAHAQVLISNNTGPVHVAAAVGTPVVVLYALTNPQHTPWLTASRVLFHDVDCRNCLKSVCPQVHHACLDRVEPEEVAAAALALVAQPPHLAPAARPLADGPLPLSAPAVERTHA
jgi:lipopolysaccharide heptosyltransferase II